MKVYSDRHLFRAMLFFLLAFLCFLEGWIDLRQDRLLLGGWLRFGFFFLLFLRSLAAAVWKKGARAALVRENDDWEQRKRLKACRAAVWAGMLSLLLFGFVLSRLGAGDSVQWFGVGLDASGAVVLFTMVFVDSFYTLARLSESGKTAGQREDDGGT